MNNVEFLFNLIKKYLEQVAETENPLADCILSIEDETHEGQEAHVGPLVFMEFVLNDFLTKDESKELLDKLKAECDYENIKDKIATVVVSKEDYKKLKKVAS